MTFDEFQASLSLAKAPALGAPLEALWHDARGAWQAAHGCVDADGTPDGKWVHAYLHRKEGDLDNAGYWYRQAERAMPSVTLEAEWRTIAETLLAKS